MCNAKYLMYFFIICFLCLTGCALKFEDVSEMPEYKNLINQKYILSKDMSIYGVNLPPGYKKNVNIYLINPIWPKIIGPEIIMEDILKPKTVLKVQSIRRSINHLPGYQSVDAIIEVESYEKAVGIPVVIDLKYLQSTNYMQKLD